MRKIGILTIHHHENDGSVMQAWSLQQLLTETLPEWEVSILDIYPTGHAIDTKQIVKQLLTGKIGLRQALGSIRRLRSYERFYRARYRHASRALVTNSTTDVADYLVKNGFDAVVAGSDTLWELGNRWCGLPAPPNYYFLPGIGRPIKKIAYAISADPLPPEIPRDVDVSGVKEAIEDFDYISLRDETTRQFVTALGVDPERLNFMPDPTIAFDFSAHIPDTKLPTPKEQTVCLAITDPERRIAVAEEVRKAGFAVANMVGSLEQANWDKAGALEVEQRLGVYKNIALLITDRFHSSIFTLKLNGCRTPILFLEDGKKWPLANSKGRDLFRRLGLEAFVIRPDETAVAQDLIRQTLGGWNAQVSAVAIERLRALADLERKELGRIRELLDKS